MPLSASNRPPPTRLIQIAQVELKGIGKRSKLSDDEALGLFPRRIKLGKSAVWPEHEIDLLVAARIAGKPDDEIRALVQSLHAKRQTDFAALTGASV